MPIFASVSPIPSDDTLTTFLCHAVAANRGEQKTLTLVLPTGISLQPAFFRDLARSWQVLRDKLSLGTDVMLRVDFCSDESRSAVMRECIQRVQQWRCQRSINRHNLNDVILLTRCLVVGRPVRDPSTIVMGIADPLVTLPEWVKPTQISMPSHSPSREIVSAA